MNILEPARGEADTAASRRLRDAVARRDLAAIAAVAEEANEACCGCGWPYNLAEILREEGR